MEIKYGIPVRTLIKRGVPLTLLITLVSASVVLMANRQTHADGWRELTWTGWQHLLLVAGSLFPALLVGIGTGILLSRHSLRSVANYVVHVINIGSTLPTLAVLALAMMWLGIGDIPAMLALFLASLAPIVRNSWMGLSGVPALLTEAARAMGMTRWQCLWRVELPYAFPDIMAGVRTAATINTGTAPLAFLIGASGYGELIFPGIYLNDWPLLLLGASATALTALLLDTLLLGCTRLYQKSALH